MLAPATRSASVPAANSQRRRDLRLDRWALPKFPTNHRAAYVRLAHETHQQASAIAAEAAARAQFRAGHGCTLLFRPAVSQQRLPRPSRQLRSELCACGPARSPGAERSRAAEAFAVRQVRCRASNTKRIAGGLFSQGVFAEIRPRSPTVLREIFPAAGRQQAPFRYLSTKSAAAR